jgi:RNA polymerase sigma factor (sigma-70 family)|tara:strand:+ start:17185 stop:17763 length:579 start_codon:yes stop_codon:yes gene_type:complete
METVSLINSMAETRPNNAIVIKQSKKKVCKNRIEMPFKELITYLSKKLEGYAMSLSRNNYDDAQDLIQTTILKLMDNQAKLMDSDQPMSYAKRILKNNFIDNYRKEKRMISIEANDIPITNDGFQEQSVMYQELLSCLEKFDETDKTILAMLGAGNSYEEIQEVVENISMANLRVKASRARIRLANCMGKKL